MRFKRPMNRLPTFGKKDKVMLIRWLSLSFVLLISQAAVAASDGYIYDFMPPVLINGKIASKHSPIHFGDEIITGSRGRIAIKLDGNVYRMGHQSHLLLPKEDKDNIIVNFIFGSLLAVFRHDAHKEIRTRTAVLGVRGTGLYLQEDNHETYLCTCYGDVDFADKDDAENFARIHADYHNAVDFNHHSHRFSKRTMINHDTPELVELETYASRLPPKTCAIEFAVNNTVQWPSRQKIISQ
jgi:hypothetical protein